MKFLCSEHLSQHKYKTPEGYLICVDSVLSRTGKQTYKRSEVFADGDDSEIEINRTVDEVFSPIAIASFENKPITVEHPNEDVNTENYKEYSVGFVRDVHQGKNETGEDVLLGTLVITDQQTIDEIENGEHTDLSCGYDCDVIDYEQKNIRGNHVALCQCGRAGIAHIVDSVKDGAWKYRIMLRKNFNNKKWEYLDGSDDLYSAKYQFNSWKKDHDVVLIEEDTKKLVKDSYEDLENDKNNYIEWLINVKKFDKEKADLEANKIFANKEENKQTNTNDYESIDLSNKKIEDLPLKARTEMRNSKDKEAALLSIKGQIDDIINAADPSLKGELKMKKEKILSDLKKQFTLDSFSEAEIKEAAEKLHKEKPYLSIEECIAKVKENIKNGNCLLDSTQDAVMEKMTLTNALWDLEELEHDAHIYNVDTTIIGNRIVLRGTRKDLVQMFWKEYNVPMSSTISMFDSLKKDSYNIYSIEKGQEKKVGCYVSDSVDGALEEFTLDHPEYKNKALIVKTKDSKSDVCKVIKIISNIRR